MTRIALVWLLVVVCVATASPAPQSSVVWSVDEGVVTLLLQSHGGRMLVTMDGNTRVGVALAKEKVVSALSPPEHLLGGVEKQCVLRDVAGTLSSDFVSTMGLASALLRLQVEDNSVARAKFVATSGEIVCRGVNGHPLRWTLLKADHEAFHSLKPELSMEIVNDKELIAKSKALYERLTSKPREYPFEAKDIIADGISEALFWAYTFVTNHWGPLHPFQTYAGTNETGLYDLATGASLPHTGYSRGKGSSSDDEIRIALSADWGSGTRESAYVAELMMQGFDPHHTMHVGDVYLLGTVGEVESNALGIPPKNAQKGVKWPHGSVATWALQGNHERYSRSYGYYDHWLPTIGVNDPATGKPQGQKASYLSLENDYWRVVSLDTGFNTYSKLIQSHNNTQPEAIIQWLNDTVRLWDESDKRGIILVSHHQYLSAFGSPSQATPDQIQRLVPNRPIIWLWGHEHRLAWYNLGRNGNNSINAYGRCLGVGGFPTEHSPVPPKSRQSGLRAFDDREYEVISGLFNMTAGYNGFTHLRFKGPTVTLEYRSLELVDGVLSNTNSTLLVTEQFSVDPATGGVNLDSFDVVDKDITVVSNID